MALRCYPPQFNKTKKISPRVRFSLTRGLFLRGTEKFLAILYAMDNCTTDTPVSTNTAKQTHDVNTYLHTLADDVHKMMGTMSPEERMMMRDKLHDLEMLM